MSFKKIKGFTLIELLVVIAIIGIFSSIVAVSLNATRTKGNDTGIKSNLANLRAQAEFYYSGNRGSYLGVCGTAPASDGAKTINAQLIAAAKLAGLSSVATTITSVGAYNLATCHDSISAWAAEIPLKASSAATPVMLCVDSTGKLKQQSAALAANAVTCI